MKVVTAREQLLKVVTISEEEDANQKPLEEELQSLEGWQQDDAVGEERVETSKYKPNGIH